MGVVMVESSRRRPRQHIRGVAPLVPTTPIPLNHFDLSSTSSDPAAYGTQSPYMLGISGPSKKQGFGIPLAIPHIESAEIDQSRWEVRYVSSIDNAYVE